MLKNTPVGTWAAVLLAGSLLFNSGCEVLSTGAVVGTQAVDEGYTQQGDLVAILHSDYYTIIQSTRGGLGLLRLALPDEQKDSLSDTLTTYNADGDRIVIVVTKINQAITRVSIHYGDKGNEYYSRNILANIQKSV